MENLLLSLIFILSSVLALISLRIEYLFSKENLNKSIFNIYINKKYRKLLEDSLNSMNADNFEKFINYAISQSTNENNHKSIKIEYNCYIECKHFTNKPSINKTRSSIDKFIVYIDNSENSASNSNNTNFKLWYTKDFIDFCMSLDKQKLLSWLGYKL